MPSPIPCRFFVQGERNLLLITRVLNFAGMCGHDYVLVRNVKEYLSMVDNSYFCSILTLLHPQ